MYYCSRQRAGPLTKECRAIRPRFSRYDAPTERRGKVAAARAVRTAVNRSAEDRLEIQLAAIGWNAMHYVLTFSPDWLPQNYSGVREAKRSFDRAARRRYAAAPGRKSRGLRYVSVIEGLHSEYHIHFICDADDLDYETVAELWDYGIVLSAEWVLQDQSGFRGLAHYLCKERNDGVRIPLGKQQRTCSRALSAEIPAPKCWRDADGAIRPDEGAVCFSTPTGAATVFDNGWGVYAKLSWLTPDGSKACRRALRRMGYRVKEARRCAVQTHQLPGLQG